MQQALASDEQVITSTVRWMTPEELAEERWETPLKKGRVRPALEEIPDEELPF